MKKFISILAIITGLCSTAAYATTYSISTSDFSSMPSSTSGNTGNHYIWGFNSITNTATNQVVSLTSLLNGQSITGATLTITNLKNWELNTNDKLFIDLLNAPGIIGTTSKDGIQDNFSGVSDFFQQSASQTLYKISGKDQLGTAVATSQYYPNPYTLQIVFNSAELADLTNFIKDVGGDIGIGLDAHCHWYDDSIKLCITTAPVPEPGTIILLGAGIMGLGLVRSRKNRKL
jgi:hypothetical protein